MNSKNSKNTENMDQFIDNVADETLSPSQSLLPPPPPPDMSTPVSQAPPLQFINSVPSLLATSAPLYQHQQQVPQMHFTSVGLSDNDVMRVALQVKLMISDEIDRLVREKVESATYDFRNAIEALRIENKELRGNLSDMEMKLESRIDELEQYSRRSCIRVAGISESDNENTDEIVLELASRLDVKIERNDIEVSHRVGRSKYQSSVNNAPSGRQIKSREIIVKFRNHQARLDLLKARSTLRERKEKIYINEDITQYKRNLSYQCRELTREKKIAKTWVYGGNVFISDRDGNRVKVSHVTDLDKYKALTVPKEPRRD